MAGVDPWKLFLWSFAAWVAWSIVFQLLHSLLELCLLPGKLRKLEKRVGKLARCELDEGDRDPSQ